MGHTVGRMIHVIIDLNWMQCVPKGSEIWLEGREVRRDVSEDTVVEVAEHGTRFQISKITKICHREPITDGGRMFRFSEEGRAGNGIVGTIQVGANEEEDKK
jgi:hypothetical protein